MIIVHLNEVDANCCPSPAADVDVVGTEVAIDFSSVTTDELCNCMCITDFTVEVGPVESGSYHVSVDYDGAFLGDIGVTVP